MQHQIYLRYLRQWPRHHQTLGTHIATPHCHRSLTYSYSFVDYVQFVKPTKCTFWVEERAERRYFAEERAENTSKEEGYSQARIGAQVHVKVVQLFHFNVACECSFLRKICLLRCGFSWHAGNGKRIHAKNKSRVVHKKFQHLCSFVKIPSSLRNIIEWILTLSIIYWTKFRKNLTDERLCNLKT